MTLERPRSTGAICTEVAAFYDLKPPVFLQDVFVMMLRFQSGGPASTVNRPPGGELASQSKNCQPQAQGPGPPCPVGQGQRASSPRAHHHPDSTRASPGDPGPEDIDHADGEGAKAMFTLASVPQSSTRAAGASDVYSGPPNEAKCSSQRGKLMTVMQRKC